MLITEQITLTIERSPISLKHIILVSLLRSTPNHIRLKYRCPDYCRVGNDAAFCDIICNDIISRDQPLTDPFKKVISVVTVS